MTQAARIDDCAPEASRTETVTPLASNETSSACVRCRYLGTARCRMPQQQVIEHRPFDLPRLRRGHRGCQAKIGIALDRAVTSQERGTPLLWKASLPDDIAGANRRERVVDRRQE